VSLEPVPGASPSALLFREIGTTEKTYAYRRLTPFTWAVFGLAGLNALSLVLLVVGLVMRLVVLNTIQSHGYDTREAMMAAANGADAIVRITGVVLLPARLVAVIAGGFWIYNAACNARGLGARGLHASPGWSVGYYAIPIAAWFMPFLAIEEIDKASRAPLNWQREPTPLLLRFWWTAWVASNIGGPVLNLVSKQAIAMGDLAPVNIALLAVTIVDLAAIICFLLIVRRIDGEQARSRAGLNDVAQVFA
jgi:hypothetical protein